ncbi:DUF6660 family protein [Robiginitalea sediminis]|uniref:DUF6660 family protein n=1 Tax=Robiginitalea sediminis TaxID=1982593 RepID=UPI000B4B59E7|nr:DUF6660 family protein [Robiginitalea sediminis]
MKWASIILTVYFLCLNALPCNDARIVIEGDHTTFSIDLSADHSLACELCSPFCQCHCCHVHIIHFDIANFEPLQATISQDNFAHFERIGKDNTFSIFQPPQV